MAPRLIGPQVERRVAVVKYGAMLVALLGWVVIFAGAAISVPAATMAWFRDCVLPSALDAGAVALLCGLVYQVYRLVLDR